MSRLNGRARTLSTLTAGALLAAIVSFGPPLASASPEPTSLGATNQSNASHGRYRAVSSKESTQKTDWRVASIAAASDAAGPVAALGKARSVGLAVAKGKVRLVIETSDVGLASLAVSAAGGDVEAIAGDLIQALVPPGQVRRLVQEPVVSYVRPPYAHSADATVDEGVSVTNATAWQLAGQNGAGVKVAIIDLTFAGYAAAQASGDLPVSVTTVDNCSGQLSAGDGHGTAVAEIVHKMAPSAQLFLICVDTEVTLANAEAYVKANSIPIVNHSVGWYNTSRGDGSGGAGTPDATVADASANGILWVNAAGNSAQDHWSGSFSDPDINTWNNFSGAIEANTFFLPAGGTAHIFLKWDNWPVSANDYDLYLFPTTGITAVAFSQNFQTGSQPPTEQIDYTNPGPDQTFDIQIANFSAAQAPRFDLFVEGNVGPLSFDVTAGSVTEPASSSAAFAAGAVCWNATTIEPFSAQGPTIDGRTKPDISGPDGTSSAVYGTSTGCDGSGFPGTSAASPHVAGASALVLGSHPTWTATQVRSFLQSNATDLGSVGPDNIYGFGNLLLPNQAPAITSASSATFGVGAAGTFTVTTSGVPTPSLGETGALPGGVTFVDNGNGTGTLAGTPGAATGGTYPITFTAANGIGTDATQPFTLTVNVPPPPSGGGGGGGPLPSPSFTLSKGVAATQAGPFGLALTTTVGSKVWYQLVLKNTGAVDLTGLTVTDSATGSMLPPGCGAVPSPLASAASYACVYSAIAVAGVSVNTATATYAGTSHTASVIVTATGPAVALTDGIAPGVNRGTSGFTTRSVILAKPGYVTFLVRLDKSLSGKIVEIWTKSKTGVWKLTTSRFVAADGTVHYYSKISAWTGFLAKYVGASSHGRIGTVR